MKKLSRETVIAGLMFIVLVALVILLCLDLIPILKQVLADRQDESKMVSYIDAYGYKGIPILIGLQAIQVILTIVPAAAIQVLAGLCYGIWFGTLICTVGYLIGNLIVFFALRQFGKAMSTLIKRSEVQSKKNKLINLKKLKQLRHPEYLAFALYLIPFVPNGILPYLFAQTKITYKKYLFCVVIASFPSTIICTWLGDRISKGDLFTALIIAGIVAVILLVLFIFRNRIKDYISVLEDKS